MTDARRLAQLTPEEDHVWVKLFCITEMSGADELAADHEAWVGLREEFPRLNEYDGALP